MIPFVSLAGESVRAVRVASKADEIVDAVDDVHDAAKAIDGAKNTTKAFKKAIDRLGINLIGEVKNEAVSYH